VISVTCNGNHVLGETEAEVIISHKFRYVFVELPNTASTAISKELCENYGGTPILRKHSHYHELLEIATAEERAYFTFSGIRNPLDVAVTRYFKLKTNHQEFFTNPKYWEENGGHITAHHRRMFQFVQDTKADFTAFLKRYYRLPYGDWSSLAHSSFDFIIRFENLHNDFATVLRLLKIEQVRSLPSINVTAEKSQDFLSYYTPEVRDRARWVFGPHMKEWGYEFPPEWGDHPVPWSSQLLFRVLGICRRYLKWKGPHYGRLLKGFSQPTRS
jgi:hypothetical protein